MFGTTPQPQQAVLNDTGYSSFNGSFAMPMLPPAMFHQIMGMQAEQSALTGSQQNTAETSNASEQQPRELPEPYYRTEPPFQIVGRLGLLNNNATYFIQLDEIKRRLGAPEKLNISYINGIVRKAKGTDAGKILHDILNQNGLSVPHGQRTNVRPTCFLPLCEDETKKLADDFRHLNEKLFPKADFRKVMKARISKNRAQVQCRAQMLRNFLAGGDVSDDFLRCAFEAIPQQLVRILNEDKTLEIQRRKGAVTGPQPMDADLQKGLWNLNLTTHNFAGLGIRGAIAPFCGRGTSQQQ